MMWRCVFSMNGWGSGNPRVGFPDLHLVQQYMRRCSDGGRRCHTRGAMRGPVRPLRHTAPLTRGASARATCVRRARRDGGKSRCTPSGVGAPCAYWSHRQRAERRRTSHSSWRATAVPDALRRSTTPACTGCIASAVSMRRTARTPALPPCQHSTSKLVLCRQDATKLACCACLRAYDYTPLRPHMAHMARRY